MAAACPCESCLAYTEDTLESAAISPFPEKRRRRLRPHLRLLAAEIVRSIHAYLPYYAGKYKDYVEQCKMVETFAGRSAMLDSFFEGQIQAAALLQLWSIVLTEAGAGAQTDLQAWLRDQFFALFSGLLQIHNQHTKAEPVVTLVSPAAALFKETAIVPPGLEPPPLKAASHTPAAAYRKGNPSMAMPVPDDSDRGAFDQLDEYDLLYC